ncbi:MAG TPA: family 1 glycosylhydrolase [Acidimicrobiales bacterium]|nr:family 1 glycosylhydrolase [Acidimicrobiales bacterium]
MTLPAGFRFGVATSGFQVEGGYNGPGEPANNWSWWEAEGRVEPAGGALDFWRQYERHLDRAVEAGCDAFRMSVEWARCEPRDGQPDDTAFDHYCAILDACHDRGLQPLLTLHHFTHPAWLGVDFWLQPDSPERFRDWVRVAVERFAGRCRHWVTLNEINVVALMTYFAGAFPPGRRWDVAATVRTLDHMLAAHVLAYGVIKERQPQAVVTTNSYPLSVYELDRLLLDVLLARRHGIGRHDLRPWLEERRREYHDAAVSKPGLFERVLRKRANSAVHMEQALPRAVAAAYASDRACTLDVTALDYYAPDITHHARRRALWDDPVRPQGLARYAALNVEPGLDVWVAENGLCSRGSSPRRDGWTRPRYLQAHLASLLEAVDRGVPLTAYYHWTLADNYEWGSYAPRFGLHGVDRATLRWSDTDSMGDASAAEYRRLIEELRP